MEAALPILGNVHQLMYSGGLDSSPHPAEGIGPEIRARHEPAARGGGQRRHLLPRSRQTGAENPRPGLRYQAQSPGGDRSIIFYGCKGIGFAPYGNYWRQMRKMCIVEILSARRVSSFRSTREEEVPTLVSHIRVAATACGEEGVDLRDMLFSMTSNITYRYLDA
ncbi:unnamed protein product [Linum tenue]|uniref:Uncharacterized protein n=1 Tax=Linum tenue TaxID=586396 RepID=A0AAV0Q817_9ROSI|nr:unnamed protein product [Linum tenue]